MILKDEKQPAVGKREARKQDRRAAILSVAQRLFLENGYAGMSMSAICAELGGSKGTLWRYFPSKEELFGAVVEEATVEFRRELVTVLEPRGDLEATLRAFSHGFMRKVTSPEAIALNRLIIGESPRFPEIGEIFLRRAPIATQKLLADFLADHIAQGHLRQVDPARAARTLLTLCHGGVQQRILWGQVRPGDRELNEEADFAVDLFLRAFAPERGR